jgi:hypothetical protein
MSRAQIKEMLGQQFGRLRVIEFARKDKHNKAVFYCACDCGKEVVVCGTNLRSGNSQSCGCLKRERSAENGRKSAGVLSPHFKHGHSGNAAIPNSPTYMSWKAIKQRCLDPKSKSWSEYGGANPPVKICDRWLDQEHGFENFLADLGERLPRTTLGRFGDIGDYQPGNVAWQTAAEQVAERQKKFTARKLRLAA